MLPFAPVTDSSDLFREVRITRIVSETYDAKTFALEAVTGDLDFKAGQFLTFVFPTQSGLARRSYSLSSAPGEPPAVTIKRMPNGIFSRPMLENAEVGDRLTIAGGPAGFFTLPEGLSRYRQIFFLAAGSGITPIFSMIKSLLNSDHKLPIVLAYSNTSPESAMFRKPLEELAARYPERFTILWFYSSHQDLWKARLNKLVLDDILKQYGKGRPSESLAYLCGPFDYMRMAAIVLQAQGIPADNIRREVFTPDVRVVHEQPPDTDMHVVTIRIHGRTHRLMVKYPDTILASAKARGIELPYSCEAGRCGSCIAACTQGKVWMRYNEVLTDSEVTKGRILTCQSFPVGGDADITFDTTD